MSPDFYQFYLSFANCQNTGKVQKTPKGVCFPLSDAALILSMLPDVCLYIKSFSIIDLIVLFYSKILNNLLISPHII
jgi:hypothetical protein